MARKRLGVLATAVTVGALALSVSPAEAAEVYVVRPGDSLFAIANRFDVSLSTLVRSNGLSLDSVIVPGQRLTVPGASTRAPTASGASTYTVRSGDWLSRIASRHDVSLDALLAANGLRPTSLIVPGQQLVIPGAAGGAATPPPASAGAGSYTVRQGDWLGRIASRHNVTLSALLSANGLSATSLIVPGQRLVIPAGGSASGGGQASGAAGRSYTVVGGDTLGGIAQRHGVSLGALLSANGLQVSSLILPGQSLTIPAGGAPAGGGAAPSASAAARIDAAVNFALAQVGKGYRFAGRGPWVYDCSGLTLTAYARAGVTLVHYSAAQARQGRAVDFWNSPIQRGDLVFMDTNGDGVINHVGIAVNSTTWVQARETRRGVTVERLPDRQNITAVRRMINQ
jgi:LysM repeat protein